MKSTGELNYKNQLNDEDVDLENPTTPLVKRNCPEMMDLSFGSSNLLSQNDVGWGSPIDPFAQEYEDRKRKRKLANRSVVTTPVRIVKRCASSPALGENSKRRSDPSKSKPEECKNLNDMFEDSDMDTSSQEINFDWELKTEDPVKRPGAFDHYLNNTSIDDILSTLPLEEIAKATKKGASHVDIKFDPQVGSSQVVREESIAFKQAIPAKSFVRHNSLPVSSTKKSPEDEKGLKQRLCTPAEIAAKRQAALERLMKNRDAAKNLPISAQILTGNVPSKKFENFGKSIC